MIINEKRDYHKIRRPSVTMVFKEYLLRPTINNKRLHLKINLLMNFAGKVSFSQKLISICIFRFPFSNAIFKFFKNATNFVIAPLVIKEVNSKKWIYLWNISDHRCFTIYFNNAIFMFTHFRLMFTNFNGYVVLLQLQRTTNSSDSCSPISYCIVA